MSDSAPILLYDGTCGFCASSVQFVLAHEGPNPTLRFASLQGEFATKLHERHPELGAIDSLIWYEPAGPHRDERILTHSEAVLKTARYLGGVWRMLGALGSIVPRSLRNWAYRFLARHRYGIAGRTEACLLPTPEQRLRFLDFCAPIEPQGPEDASVER